MTSWLLTLVVVPVVFTYMDGWQIWIFNLMRGKKRGEGRSKATEKAQMVESKLENSDRLPPKIDRQNAILKIRK